MKHGEVVKIPLKLKTMFTTFEVTLVNKSKRAFRCEYEEILDDIRPKLILKINKIKRKIRKKK